MYGRWRRRLGAQAFVAAALLVAVMLTGCGAVPRPVGDQQRSPSPADRTDVERRSATSAPTSAATSPAPKPTSDPTPTQSPQPAARPAKPTPAPAPPASDGRPRVARLTIGALDLTDLTVRPHRGTPDDARGTRIQNGGVAASPYGTGGLVGPGGIGNYLITGHRTSSTQPFEDLPRLRNGARVHVESDGKRYTYRIVDTRRTSFRSKKSLAEQSAAVPGRPGIRPTRAMITLSTCRTPEDRAEGNTWSDRFGNPEHRIDKIGILVTVRPV